MHQLVPTLFLLEYRNYRSYTIHLSDEKDVNFSFYLSFIQLIKEDYINLSPKEIEMDDLALLATISSLHQLIEKFLASPPMSSLLWISSISGIVGVAIGFILQEAKNFFVKRSTSNKEKHLIEFELRQIMENCITAIKTGVYLINNHENISRSKVTVPNPSSNFFYKSFIANVASVMKEDKLLSIASAYEYISELDKDITHLDDITSTDMKKRLYNYEWVISMATRAYNHAENALSEKPAKYDAVSFDHAELPKKLGFECDYLFKESRIDRT